MKLLIQYTFDNVRRNKRTSLSILIAVFLSSILLCTACIYAYSAYRWRSDLESMYSGSWHAELGGEILGKQLSFIDSYLDVEKSMIKGPYSIVKLSSDSSLPYLLLRNADANYWEEMGEKSTIMEGRVPQKPGEIVVAKSFFQKNPHYQIGDTITLPVGKRLDGETLLDVETWREGEIFLEEDKITLTFVGMFDLTTSTVTPGYYAMGYLDRAAILPEEEFVVYVKLKNIRKTYEVMPRLAESLGILKNEYGNYENHFCYHTALLALNLTFPPDSIFRFHQEYFSILMMVLLILLVACAFIYIIQNVFALSAQRKITQLGIFRSIGASPAQIRFSLLLECLVLAIPSILLGLGVGYFFTKFTLEVYAQILGDLNKDPVLVQCSPFVVLLAFLLCLATVLISAWIPARRSSRLSPVDAIRGKQSHMQRRKFSKTGWIFAHFGVEGSLASASYYAHRKSFRSSISALFFCLLLTTGFSCLVEISNFNSQRNNHALFFNITARLQMTAPPDQTMIEEIQQIEGIQDMVWYGQTKVSYWASEEEESLEFQEHGGYPGIKNPSLYNLYMQDGKWRTPVYLFGIADAYFDRYCDTLGLSLEVFYQQDTLSVIACSSAPLYPFSNNPEKMEQSYPLLNLSAGQKLQLEEKTRDSMETDYQFTAAIAAITTTTPPLDIFHSGTYAIRLYMPLSSYYRVVDDFMPDSVAGTHRLWMELKTDPDEDLRVTNAVREILSAWFSEEDLYLISTAEEEKNTVIHTLAMEMMIWCISALLALIGISTAFLTVASSMQQRRREYAMLRSVGMDFQGIQKLLFLEGIRLAVTPVCMVLPILFLVISWLFSINDISWKEFLPYFPFAKLVVSILLELAAVAGAYWISSGQIRHDIIIEAVREDTV